MLNNTITNELKAKDKNIFRALNQCYGFNFENDFTLVKLETPVTIGKALKAIYAEHPTPSKYSVNAGGSRVVVLLIPSNRWNNDKIKAVQIYGTGASDFEVEHCKRWFDFKTILDYYFRKGDFNEDRKNAEAVYIIAQKNADLARVYKKYEADFNDINARFILKRANKTTKNWRRENEFDFISSLDLLTVENNKKADYGVIYRQGHEPQNVNDIIDKSGYIVNVKRSNLQNKAEELRKERAANKYKATDNSAIIAGVLERADRLKQSLVEMLANAKTSEEIRDCGNLIKYYDGLEGIFGKCERLATMDAKKEFRSIASFNEYVNQINENIDDIIGKMAVIKAKKEAA